MDHIFGGSLGSEEFLKKVRRWTEGPLPEDLWAEADRLSDQLDAAIATVITRPDFLQLTKFRLRLDICGPEKLWEFHPEGKQHCLYERGHHVARVLGGPLPNGKTYLSYWGGGHEAGHKVADVDNLCKGLEQQGLWEEAYGMGGRLDAELKDLIVKPRHFERREFALSLYLCGPERLRRLLADPGPYRPQDETERPLYVLGGYLPNGRTYVSHGALGQQLAIAVSGVANPCVGL